VRLRLALIYSGLFLLAGIVLLGVTYGLVAGSLASGKVVPGTVAGTRATDLLKGTSLGELCKSGQADPQQLAKCKGIETQAYESGLQAAAAAARDDVLNNLLAISLGALALTTVLSAWLGWIAAGRALRPVHTITAAARRASEENLGERIALSGPVDELKELADTFDAMLARLDAAFASQRRFVANASHELRTPLTVMRTAIDVTLAKPTRTSAHLEAMAVEVRQAAEQAEALIEALLTLARSDRGLAARAPLDMAVFAEAALETAEPEFRAASLRLACELDPALAAGDPVLVERMIGNLIHNAARHNVPGGWVEVATGCRDGMAFIRVANGGPIIPDAEVASLFEPFRRLRRDHEPAQATREPGLASGQAGLPGSPPGQSLRREVPEGVGLGLSIVRSVVTAHHGRVTACPGEAGGLEVCVLLPAGYVRA
jgi:signal transduction histidine kinase